MQNIRGLLIDSTELAWMGTLPLCTLQTGSASRQRCDTVDVWLQLQRVDRI